MELAPARAPLPIARIRPDWPGLAIRQAGMAPRAPARTAAQTADVAHKFETLIAETLLRSARAANLGDDGLGETGGNIRDMVDHARAEAIARAAPMGVARLLARETANTSGAAPAPEAANKSETPR